MAEPDTSLKPRARQKLQTRERILDAALTAFAEKGFEGASIREIATRAGVMHGLIKHHFDGKEQLWKAAVDRLFERQEEEMAPSAGYADLSAHERFRDWLRRYVRYCAKHPEHARIMVQESMAYSDRLRWAVDKHIRRVHEEGMEDIRGYVAEGVFPDIRPLTLIYMLFAAAQSPFMLAAEVALVEGVDMTKANEIDAYADELYTLLIDHSRRL